MKIKIVYLMNVSWFWIKQRPHFLAEELSKYYPVTVACFEDYNKQSQLNLSERKGMNLVSFMILSTKFKSNFIARSNFYLKKLQLRQLIKTDSLIWFTSPVQYLHSESLINSTNTIVYDCMDNAIEFHSELNVRKSISQLEQKLCQRADIVFASSETLQQVLHEKYGIGQKITVINNAIKVANLNSKHSISVSLQAVFSTKDVKYISYIGTISKWFDFESIILALNQFSNIIIILVGPTDVEIPKHPQLKYVGIVEHSLVGDIMRRSTALIMPFKITDLVKSVNPVKAYEYIHSGKPIILSYYHETIKFEEFAYLYSNLNQLSALFMRISLNSLNPKQTWEDCTEFVKKHTWEARGIQIENIIRDEIQARRLDAKNHA